MYLSTFEPILSFPLPLPSPFLSILLGILRVRLEFQLLLLQRHVPLPPHPPPQQLLLPTVQRLRDRDVVNLHPLPVSLRQHGMRDAGRSENRRDVREALPKSVSHFVDVVPLLFRHGSADVIRVHLGLVEEPLEDEERIYGRKVLVRLAKAD